MFFLPFWQMLVNICQHWSTLAYFRPNFGRYFFRFRQNLTFCLCLAIYCIGFVFLSCNFVSNICIFSQYFVYKIIQRRKNISLRCWYILIFPKSFFNGRCGDTVNAWGNFHHQQRQQHYEHQGGSGQPPAFHPQGRAGCTSHQPAGGSFGTDHRQDFLLLVRV